MGHSHTVNTMSCGSIAAILNNFQIPGKGGTQTYYNHFFTKRVSYHDCDYYVFGFTFEGKAPPKRIFILRLREVLISGLYYKCFTIVIYDHIDIGLYFKTRDDRN